MCYVMPCALWCILATSHCWELPGCPMRKMPKIKEGEHARGKFA